MRKLENKNMSSRKSGFSIFLGISLSLFCIGGAVWLLFIGKLAGAEFVALVLGGIVLSLIIYFSSEIQEFSIAGNVVKLRELKDEAHQTIESLKQARTEIFRLMLPQIFSSTGTFGTNSLVDVHAEKFIILFNQIEKFDSVVVLKDDIDITLKKVMARQYNELSIIHETPVAVPFNLAEINLGSFWTPQALSLHLTDAMVEAQRKHEDEFIKVKEDIYNAVDVYKKLYVIYKKIMSLPNS
ncbi:hypothetical protein ACX1NY_04390 [Acinetobacter sp. ANC 4631]